MQGGAPRAELRSALEKVERWGARTGWVGPDPYEGLNSAVGRIAPGRRSRQAVTQVYKRLPFAPPWPLRAHPRPNAKALALALAGYATPSLRELPAAERFLEELPRRIEELNLVKDGNAWGYPFEVQTRRIRYPPSTPNAIVTCFVVEGLLDAFEATGQERCLTTALAARGPLMGLLQDRAPAPYFAYVPAGSDLIHNANVLVCGALARLQSHDPQRDIADAVMAATSTTVEAQGEDGLWPYGEAPGYEWVDNFHTAYTLEGLRQVEAQFGGFEEPLARGFAAWRDAFALVDGWTPYYPGRRYPLEAHSAASAIDLLCALGSDQDLERAAAVGDCAIAELWVPEFERFAYRRTKRGLNRRAFMRWTNAPMFRALARLASARQSSAT